MSEVHLKVLKVFSPLWKWARRLEAGLTWLDEKCGCTNKRETNLKQPCDSQTVGKPVAHKVWMTNSTFLVSKRIWGRKFEDKEESNTKERMRFGVIRPGFKFWLQLFFVLFCLLFLFLLFIYFLSILFFIPFFLAPVLICTPWLVKTHFLICEGGGGGVVENELAWIYMNTSSKSFYMNIGSTRFEQYLFRNFYKGA